MKNPTTILFALFTISSIFILSSTQVFAQETKIALPTSNNHSSFTVIGRDPDRKMKFFADGGFYVGGDYGDGAIPLTGAGTRMMFYPHRAAFRVGYVDGTQWNDSNVGNYSTAMGYTTTASGNCSTAMGKSTTASEFCSTAMGYQTTASGNYSTAMGKSTTAKAYVSTAIGRYNYNAGTAYSWVDSDPIFEIGIGSSSSMRANAFTVLKNGNIGINEPDPDVELHVRDKGNDGNAEIRIAAGSNDIARLSFYQSTTRQWQIQNSSSNGYLYIYNADGTATVRLGQNATSWSAASDKRLKEKFEPIENVLKKIESINPVTYYFKGKEKKEIGLIAQEVLPQFPEIVTGEETDSTYLGLTYDRLGPILLQGIKELKAEKDKEIDDLRLTISDLRMANEKAEEKSKKLEEKYQVVSSQYSEVSKENEELKTRLAKLEKMVTQILKKETVEVANK